MRYSMASPSSATQGRCNSVQLQGWTRGDGGGGTAPYSQTHSPPEVPSATGLRARFALRQSCDEGWRLPWVRKALHHVHGWRGRRDIGEFWGLAYAAVKRVGA
jgi:hypothetical protein